MEEKEVFFWNVDGGYWLVPPPGFDELDPPDDRLEFVGLDEPIPLGIWDLLEKYILKGGGGEEEEEND